MILKISFDIGGVLSKYPEIFKPLIMALHEQGVSLYVISDIKPHEKAVALCIENGFPFPACNILVADYERDGELCKAKLIKEHGIHIHFDDFPGYCNHTECISLMVWPNPYKPYYAPEWKTDGSEGDFGRSASVRSA